MAGWDVGERFVRVPFPAAGTPRPGLVRHVGEAKYWQQGPNQQRQDSLEQKGAGLRVAF